MFSSSRYFFGLPPSILLRLSLAIVGMKHKLMLGMTAHGHALLTRSIVIAKWPRCYASRHPFHGSTRRSTVVVNGSRRIGGVLSRFGSLLP